MIVTTFVILANVVRESSSGFKWTWWI